MEKTRSELAFAYKLFAHLGWDDATYTHLSARVPGKDTFLIQPFGLLYCEVTPENLIEIDFDGNVVDETKAGYNSTGYVIHCSIYKARPELNAVFHLHTIAGVAVAALEHGLLPISQFSFHFYKNLSYHDYNSLSLDVHSQGETLAESLGSSNKAMILRNHGTLTCGETIHEAFLYMWFLEKACQVQALAGQMDLRRPSTFVLQQTAQDLRNFESDFGARDWAAWKRVLKWEEPVSKMKEEVMKEEVQQHFSTLKPPLAPNYAEVNLYRQEVYGSQRTLLLGYTKELLSLCDTAIDINPPIEVKSIVTCGDWFDIKDHYDVIIGDGVLNLVGGSLVRHLFEKGCCNKLVIRFFTEKIEGMKYATYFQHNTDMIMPNEVIKTQDKCVLLIWHSN